MAASSSSSSSTSWSIHDFEVGPAIGKGRFGSVYKCRDKKSRREVAIKVLFKAQLEEHGLVHHLKQEVETHCRLRHPNVVRCFGYFQDEHRVFVVMAYAGGGDLHRYLKDQPGRRLPDAQAAFYVRQLLEALSFLHGQGIIHRDLKPENLLLDPVRGDLLLADFGYCTSSKRLRQTVCGTQGDYLAPEMLRREPYGPAVDLWTAGILAYEVLVGRTPFYSPEHDGDDDDDECDRRAQLRFPPGVLPEARDFIARVLVEDQHARPSLEEALAHPWLAPGRVQRPTNLPRPLLPQKAAAATAASSSSGRQSAAAAALPEVEEPEGAGVRRWRFADFEISTNPVGRGRYGSVYKARCKDTRKIVALKVLFKSQLEGDGVMHQVRNEIEIHCRIAHPHVVACHGYFHDRDRVFIVMDYAPGELYQTLKRTEGGRFPEAVAAKYARQLMSALVYLHGEGYIHRDLKPENLLLDERGDLQLCDFGWSIGGQGHRGPQQQQMQQAQAQGQLQAQARRAPAKYRNTLCGTPDYLAPEMLKNQPYFESVDCWAVGVLVYEFLVGHTPFRRSASLLSPTAKAAAEAAAAFSADDTSAATALSDNDMYDNILRGELRFPPEARVSDEAKHFIVRLLEKNPARRMPLREALGHAWIRAHDPAANHQQQKEQKQEGRPGRRLLNDMRQGLAQAQPSSSPLRRPAAAYNE